MKLRILVPGVALAAIWLWPRALEAQIFSDLYMNDPGHWYVNASPLTPGTPFDYRANWGVNYITSLGVPQDPYSISTTALQLKINETSNELAGVSVSPINLTISNAFVMTFDMWINYNSGGFTSGSTQIGSYGIASNSTTATWSGVGHGYLFGETTDNGISTEYRCYSNGVSLGSAPFVAQSQNQANAFYTNLFPSVAVPAGETALDTNQFGNSFPGSISFQWVKVNVTWYNGILSESINGHLIAFYTNASVGSDIFLGFYDINNGSAGTNGLSDQNYVLFDNVQVEPFPPYIPVSNDGFGYDFVTIAGSANGGFIDDGGANAEFNGVQGTAVDANDTVYVADTGNEMIRKATFEGTNWVASTIAGQVAYLGSSDGTNGFATFRNPQGIAVDSAGNLFIADTGNSTIRKITPIGTNYVTVTIAGAAQTNGSADGLNLNSRFHFPEGIAVDRFGNLFVADTINDTIRMIAPSGTNWNTITIAGLPGLQGTNDGTSSAARFLGPEGITVDRLENVYVADTTNNTIRKLSPVGNAGPAGQLGTNWIVTTIAGLAQNSGSADGVNQDSRFNYPGGITVDGAGNLFVTDSGNETIRKIVPIGADWLTFTIGGTVGVAGYADGVGPDALFDNPKGIAVDWWGNIFIDGNSVIEGFAVYGGVTLLGQSFSSGNQYWINVKLFPPAAVTAGAAWGLQGDPPASLSSGPSYTRYFTTASTALQFVYVDKWHEPTNTTISIQTGLFNTVVTNLYYIPVAPVLSVDPVTGLNITGAPSTRYNIQWCTDLTKGQWQPLTTIILGTGASQIEAWPPPWPSNNKAQATFYRALWTGN
jgi:sugar lactone lactonase YvrE